MSVKCQYYSETRTARGVVRKHCTRAAAYTLPSGHLTCGKHERGTRSPSQGDRNLALDILEVERQVGVGRITFREWLRIFYPDLELPGRVVEARSQDRAFTRWKKRIRSLGFAPARQEVTYVAAAHGSVPIESDFVFDLPRAVAWAQEQLGEVPYRPMRRPNPVTREELLAGRGSRGMSDWAGLGLDPISQDVLGAFAHEETALTAAQAGEYLRRGGRERTVVMPHAQLRPCGTCGTEHALGKHRRHKVDAERQLRYSRVPKDRTAAARRAISELEALDLVEDAGRQGRRKAYRVTAPGIEGSMAMGMLAAERSVEKAFDPELAYEAAMARRAQRELLPPVPGLPGAAKLRAMRAAPQGDTSFDFGANLTNPPITREQAQRILLQGGYPLANGQWHWLTLAQRGYFTRLAGGRRSGRGPDETAHYRANPDRCPCGSSLGRYPQPYMRGLCRPCFEATLPVEMRVRIAQQESESRAREHEHAAFKAAHPKRRRSRRNPLLAVVGLGNPGGTRRNPTDSKKQGDRHFAGYVTIESAQQYAEAYGKVEEFEKARRDYVEFHGVEPTKLALYRIPTGGKTLTVDFGAALGRVPRTIYRTSNNGGSKDQADQWVHDHPKGGEPLEVKLASTGLTTKVGGTYEITDWWRD